MGALPVQPVCPHGASQPRGMNRVRQRAIRRKAVPGRYAARNRLFRATFAPVKRLLMVVFLTACGGGAKATAPVAPGGGATPAAPRTLVHVDAQGVGLGGYDPMAYRTFDKAVAGLPEHTATHEGATYRFSSSANASAFQGAEHAPAYGGYCAYAASQGRLSPADPLVFEIYEGKLLVFTNPELKELFDQDAAGNKAKADAAWPDLVAKNAK